MWSAERTNSLVILLIVLYNVHTTLSISRSFKRLTLNTVFVELVSSFRVFSVLLTFVLTTKRKLIEKYGDVLRRDRRMASRLLKNFKSYLYSGVSLNALLQIIVNDRQLQEDPEDFLDRHFYGFSVYDKSTFQGVNMFRLYVCIDYLLLSLHEMYLYKVVCLFCELALTLSKKIASLRKTVSLRKDSVFADISEVLQECKSINSDFSELTAAWCVVFVMTVVGFIQTVINAFQNPSRNVVKQILLNPNMMLVSTWFLCFCHVAEKPNHEASLFRIVLSKLNEKTRVESKGDVLYVRLMYRLCDEKLFTLALWQTIPFSNKFLSRAFPNILMFGVTLNQVCSSRRKKAELALR